MEKQDDLSVRFRKIEGSIKTLKDELKIQRYSIKRSLDYNEKENNHFQCKQCACHRSKGIKQDKWNDLSSSTRISYLSCLIQHKNLSYITNLKYDKEEYKLASRRAEKKENKESSTEDHLSCSVSSEANTKSDKLIKITEAIQNILTEEKSTVLKEFKIYKENPRIKE